MNFWDFYPANNKLLNSSLSAEELTVDHLTKSDVLLSNEIEQYKIDPTKYTIHNSKSMDYLDLAYKFYNDIDLWWVILLFNDVRDILMAVGDFEIIDKKVESIMNAIIYYTGSSMVGEFGNLGEPHRHFAYRLPIILGDDAYKAPYEPIGNDLDFDGIKNQDYYDDQGMGIEYIYNLMREFYIMKMKMDLFDAIKATNKFMSSGILYNDVVDDDNMNDFKLEHLLKEFIFEKLLSISSKHFQVKIPNNQVKDLMIDMMYENKMLWENKL